jgi:sulfite reductase (NADPH) flavoprotein alpha-component
MLTVEQKELLDRLIITLDSKQIIWLSGYFTGLGSNGKELNLEDNQIKPEKSVNKNLLTILYGSRSGNSQTIAEKLADKFNSNGISSKCFDMNDYPNKNLKSEKNIIVIVSTHGEGVPPTSAEEFYEFIHSKRAPKMKTMNYAVCALGDSSYEFFCKTGADFDKRFEELGATRLLERNDCDVDFEDSSELWIDKVYGAFIPVLKADIRLTTESIHKKSTSEKPSEYNKKNPFKALVLDKILLSGRGSQKENYHIELSVEGSGLKYKPGDALGIIPVNSPPLVDRLIDLKKFNAETIINNGVGSKSLRDILLHHYEISTLTKDVLSNYATITDNKQLHKIINDNTLLRDYIYGRDVLDLLNDFPARFEPDELVGILRKLQPRLYSITSSQLAYEDEVHLIIGTVRYNGKGGLKEGVCSTYLSDRINIDDLLPVYIDHNPNFKLPENPETPVIMIGPGTGVAPFRGFVQEREANGSTGKNWLFFGDQYFTTDFLYQTEWQKYLKQGILTKMDVAFSKDSSEKIYVQHRMMQHAKDIYSWLQEGAHIYVCGDSKNMAPDVFKAVTKIVEDEGEISNEKALEYMRNMQKARRYHEDVY